MFIADMYQNFGLLDKLKNKDVTIVGHNSSEISSKKMRSTHIDGR